MLKKRIIPVLLQKDGHLVRSQNFNIHQIVGDPIHDVIRFTDWAIDELIYLDISSLPLYSQGRGDIKVKSIQSRGDLIKSVAQHCFVPLAFGGGLRTFDDIRECFVCGADKVCLNSLLYCDPSIVIKASSIYGKQAIVGSVDLFKSQENQYKVFIKSQGRLLDIALTEYLKHVEGLGVGELLIQSVNLDGAATGYDINLYNYVSSIVNLPIIALGGAGAPDHFSELFNNTVVSAAAAANIFHFKELIDRHIKRVLLRDGHTVRVPY